MNRTIFISAILLVFVCCQSRKTAMLNAGQIRVGNLQVYFEQRGVGDPVLLIHAGLQNHSMWNEQVKELAKTHQVITIDLPFHGNTAGIDTAVLAKDVVRTVLDSLEIKKVSVVGLSMGAAVAQDLVIGYPDRVNKAVFISSGLNGYEKKYPIDSVSMGWYGKFVALLNAKDTAGAAMQFARSWGDGMIQQGGGLVKPASQYVYETTLTTLRQHQLKGWPNLQDEPTAFDQIETITKPVLIIHGDQDLPFIETASRYMEKHIAGSKRVLIKGAAHMLNLEKPAEVNKLLVDFLK